MKCAICGSDNANIVRRIYVKPSEQSTSEYMFIFICKSHIHAKSENLDDLPKELRDEVVKEIDRQETQPKSEEKK